MEYGEYIETITKQSDAMRAAAVEAGPDADVQNCAEWNIHKLVRHLAKVHAWAAAAVVTADPNTPPARTDPPAEFADLLPWWDEQRTRLVTGLWRHDPADPAWAFGPLSPRNVAFWARRQAHETAIHRLDAESALAAPPSTQFDPAFAADGVDEILSWIVPLDRRWTDSALVGSVLYHAADAGRAWLVTFTPGTAPEVADAADSPGGGFTADATVAGTADAVYRKVWGRPSTAVSSGNTELAGAIHGR